MSSHTCPVPGGDRPVPADMLMCSRHWYTVPKPLRRALWRAWRNGDGAGTAEHQAAMTACISAADASVRCN